MEPRIISNAELVYHRYLDLAAHGAFDSQSGLGGRLVYAGEMAEAFFQLRAANIAGAASLTASADFSVQRQAMRDGVVDFLVTSLEEALRILKNEIRKRQTVSVCVGVAPHILVEQMLDRGVLPDLLFANAGVDTKVKEFVRQGALPIVSTDGDVGVDVYVRWSVDRDFSVWMPLLDGCARSVFFANDAPRQRWLQLAPRYLGREAQRVHGVAMSSDEIVRFRNAVKQMLAREVREVAAAPVVSIDA